MWKEKCFFSISIQILLLLLIYSFIPADSDSCLFLFQDLYNSFLDIPHFLWEGGYLADFSQCNSHLISIRQTQFGKSCCWDLQLFQSNRISEMNLNHSFVLLRMSSPYIQDEWLDANFFNYISVLISI